MLVYVRIFTWLFHLYMITKARVLVYVRCAYIYLVISFVYDYKARACDVRIFWLFHLYMITKARVLVYVRCAYIYLVISFVYDY